MKKNCLECSARNHCCKTGFAFVGLEDAKKIKEATGKEYADFLDYSKLSKPVLDLLQNGDPCLESSLRVELLRDGKLLRLKKSGKNCIFLKNGECSIYKVRPKICKIYPYWCVKLLDGTIKVIDHGESLCLIRNVRALSEADELKVKELFKDILKEAKYYEENVTDFVNDIM